VEERVRVRRSTGSEGATGASTGAPPHPYPLLHADVEERAIRTAQLTALPL
jgi:hypothetical protein